MCDAHDIGLDGIFFFHFPVHLRALYSTEHDCIFHGKLLHGQLCCQVTRPSNGGIIKRRPNRKG